MEGKIQIPLIMINGTSARNPSGEVSVFLIQSFDITLAESVLIAADNDRIVIAPQVEDDLIFGYMIQKILLQRLVPVYIEGIGRRHEKISH